MNILYSAPRAGLRPARSTSQLAGCSDSVGALLCAGTAAGPASSPAGSRKLGAALRFLVRPMAGATLALSLLGGCAMNQEQGGAVLGGMAGAAVGSAVGRGSGQVAAVILGALLGSVAGANIGRHMDEQDRVRAAQVFESYPTGSAGSWRNPDTGDDYAVTPTRTYETAQGPCREFTMQATINGRPDMVYGTACRQPDGTWKVVR